MRWSDVGKRINEIDNKSPLAKLMADMLRDNGYDGFRGFTPYERNEGWLIKHQNEAVDFTLEAAEYAEGLRFYDKNRIDLHNRVQKNVRKVKNRDHYSFGPSSPAAVSASDMIYRRFTQACGQVVRSSE